MRRLGSEDGFTLIEVLAAVIVLTVGLIGLFATFESSRKLTLVAERRADAAHRAQWELEKLQAEPYSELAMITAPSHSSESTNPDYYVNYSSPAKCTSEGAGCYSFNAEQPSEEEVLVYGNGKRCEGSTVEGCGIISASPTGNSCNANPVGACEWKDGLASGNIYDFVTWHEDVVCEKEEGGKKLCTTKSYKRLTAIVTVNVSANSATHPQVRVSTLIANPSSVPEGSVINGKQNPLETPSTKCGTESCISGIQRGNPQTWYLHDSLASKETPEEPKASHETRATIAASGECTKTKTSGCPVPDLMDSTHPTATKLFDYSSGLNGEGYTLGSSEYGGRMLRKEAECSGTPGNTAGEMWVTPKLSAAVKLTGYGGLSLYTQTLNNIAATATLCIGVYDVQESLTNLVENAPKLIGSVAEYKPDTWPTTPSGGSLTDLSFVFTFLTKAQLEAKETVTIEAKHHIGLRIWPAKSSTDSIAIAYDTAGSTETVEGKTVEKPGYSSLLQLNTE